MQDYLAFEVGTRSVGGAAYAQHPPRLDGVVSVPGAAAIVVPAAAISFATLADFQPVDFL
jgi:hypothetical protein